MASPTGYVVTAGHCVDDQSLSGGKGGLIAASVRSAVEQGVIKESQMTDVYKFAWDNATVEGSTSGSPPERSVHVFLPPAAGATGQVNVLTGSGGLAANVVDFKSHEDGDVGLLKVSPPEPMPALQVAGSPPEAGTAIISAGYPGEFSGSVDTTEQPSFKSGTVSGTETANGVSFVKTSAKNTADMSGGPTVDMQGRVLGMVTYSPAQDDRPGVQLHQRRQRAEVTAGP